MADQVDTLLYYLHSHSYEQAQKVFPPEVLQEIQDIQGFLDIAFETPTVFKQIAIHTTSIPNYFKGSPAFLALPGTVVLPTVESY